MNSKGHLVISLLKSGIRILSGFMSLYTQSIAPLATGIIFAEVLGILEELVDKR